VPNRDNLAHDVTKCEHKLRQLATFLDVGSAQQLTRVEGLNGQEVQPSFERDYFLHWNVRLEPPAQ
jgi:hypothetical protein